MLCLQFAFQLEVAQSQQAYLLDRHVRFFFRRGAAIVGLQLERGDFDDAQLLIILLDLRLHNAFCLLARLQIVLL